MDGDSSFDHLTHNLCDINLCVMNIITILTEDMTIIISMNTTIALIPKNQLPLDVAYLGLAMPKALPGNGGFRFTKPYVSD